MDGPWECYGCSMGGICLGHVVMGPDSVADSGTASSTEETGRSICIIACMEEAMPMAQAG